MARAEIILGTPPQGIGGDSPRAANTKINAMTQEIYENLPTASAPLPVNKGGTGAKTPADARSNLGLGSAATKSVGVASGNIQDVSAPPAMVGNSAFAEPGSHFISYGDDTTVAPVGGAYWAGIRAQYPFENCAMDLVAQVLSTESYNLMFRTVARNGGGGPWRKIYHDGNTTRAGDGTLKAI